MSCDRLQSRSAQIGFAVSSSVFDNRKAVKHSGGACCNVFNKKFLLVAVLNEIRQVRIRWLMRLGSFAEKSSGLAGCAWLNEIHRANPSILKPCSCSIYTGAIRSRAG